MKTCYNVILMTFITRTSENGLIVLGGTASSEITRPDESPLLSSVEMIRCYTETKIPDYPLDVFGASLVWKREGLLVCGGSSWQVAYLDCFSWSTR